MLPICSFPRRAPGVRPDNVTGVLLAFLFAGPADVKTTRSEGFNTSGKGSAVTSRANSFWPVWNLALPLGARTISSPMFSALPSRATDHTT